MSRERLQTILDRIKCLDRQFVLHEQGDNFTVCVTYWENNVDTGHHEKQESRRWLIKHNACETEIVDTAFACVMRSYDHVVQEHFMYDGYRVFSPHFDLQQRIEMAAAHAAR